MTRYQTIDFAEQIQPQTGQILAVAYKAELRPAPRSVYRAYPQATRQAYGQTLWLDREGLVYIVPGLDTTD